MHRLFLRSTMLVVGAGLLATFVPLLGLLTFAATRSPDERIINRVGNPAFFLIAFSACLTVALVGLTMSLVVARRQARHLGAPLSALAVQAERLGAGDASVAPLATGIPEVDRVSEVLAANSQDMAKALAAERDFAADASHQLRTPLAALLLRLEEIEATADPEVARAEAGVAIDQVARLTGVVDDLMNRAKRRPAEAGAVSVDSVLAALQREWQPAFAAARRSMRIHGERDLEVFIVRSALSQIVSTLIENALAHGRGTVSVLVRHSGPTVVLEVSDDGDGVPPGLARHIFERSVSSTGSGLGLALARDLAEKNFGRLELLRAQPAVFALFLSDASSSSLAKTNLR